VQKSIGKSVVLRDLQEEIDEKALISSILREFKIRFYGKVEKYDGCDRIRYMNFEAFESPDSSQVSQINPDPAGLPAHHRAATYFCLCGTWPKNQAARQAGGS
jgi:hypothetical protein